MGHSFLSPGKMCNVVIWPTIPSKWPTAVPYTRSSTPVRLLHNWPVFQGILWRFSASWSNGCTWVTHGSNGCTWVTHGSEDQCVELICILLNYSCKFQMLYSLHTFTTTVGLPSSSTKKTQSLLILQNMVPLFLAVQFIWCMTLADKEIDLWQII